MNAEHNALDFCAHLQRFWGINLDSSGLGLTPDAAARGHYMRMGQSACLEVFLFLGTSASLKAVKRRFFSKHSRALLVVFGSSGRIDVYTQSLIDGATIEVQDLDWRDNAVFWGLGRCHAFSAFCVELERHFGRRRLEKRFVIEMRIFRRQMARAWQFLDTDSEEIRESLSLEILLRLLFLSFLSQRNILDARRHFMMQEATRVREAGGNVYSDFLRLFFFETLNRRSSERTKSAKAFGAIPFLNGGLFRECRDELLNPRAILPNDVVMPILEGMFERYSFSEAEGSGDKLDPMMLGHLFESLMPARLRSQTGSFYTPMHLVRRMTQTVFEQWLEDHFELSNAEAKLLTQGDVKGLSHECCLRCDTALAHIAVLDPAVGSGGFLQAAFELIFAMREGLGRRLNHHFDASDLARHIVLNNLYGVDIVESARRLCELRLWLETIRHYRLDETLPALPNLDLKIRRGNSLVELSQYARVFGLNLPKSSCDLDGLRKQYGNATGDQKRRLATVLESDTQTRSQAMLDVMIAHCQAQIDEIERNGIQPKLFGGQASLTAPNRELKKQLERHLLALIQRRDSDLATAFSFDLHFPEVMRSGGFDIVVGNPPWYGLHCLDNDEQSTLRALYRTARSLKGRGTRAQAADISALFVERALNCTKATGLLTMVLPNKLFTAPSYENFRHYVTGHAEIIQANDWSASPHDAFDAATYPAELCLRKSATSNASPEAWRVPSHDSSCADFGCQSPISSLKSRIDAHFTIKRGLCTGANHVFVGRVEAYPYDAKPLSRELPQAVSHVSFGRVSSGLHSADIESDVLYPVIRGGDIAPNAVWPKAHILLAHAWEDLGKARQDLGPNAAAYIASYADELRKRRGLERRLPQALAGCSDHLRSPKVVWRDISTELEAAYVEDPRIIPLNTVYYIPVKDADEGLLLAAYLNSDAVRKFCRLKAEHARGGYRRYFAWLIAETPWPFAKSCKRRKSIAEGIIKAMRLLVPLEGDANAGKQASLRQDIEVFIDEAIGLASQSKESKHGSMLYALS